jgi:hypothetical protein
MPHGGSHGHRHLLVHTYYGYTPPEAPQASEKPLATLCSDGLSARSRCRSAHRAHFRSEAQTRATVTVGDDPTDWTHWKAVNATSLAATV